MGSLLSVSLSLLLSVFAPGCTQPHAAAPQAVSRVSIAEQFDLSEASEAWVFRTPELWRIAREGERQFLQMAEPPKRPMLPGVRRPQEYVLYGKYQFRTFSLSARVRVDRDPSVAARDAVLIFGRQDDTHFYYVHLSGLADGMHNMVVRVDGANRSALVQASEQPPPTLTDKAWHKVDLLRNCDTGLIEVYVDAYDEDAEPVFRLTDRTYDWGHVGVGSFDDHASFDHILIEGEARETARPGVAPISSASP